MNVLHYFGNSNTQSSLERKENVVMRENLVKELSEKYNREEVFIGNIIQMTLNKGYDLNEVENIVENFFENICFG